MHPIAVYDNAAFIRDDFIQFVGEFNQDSGEFVSFSKVKVADFTDFVKKD